VSLTSQSLEKKRSWYSPGLWSLKVQISECMGAVASMSPHVFVSIDFGSSSQETVRQGQKMKKDAVRE
jgi:hypothetical protein